jgi:hypothetical protein
MKKATLFVSASLMIGAAAFAQQNIVVPGNDKVELIKLESYGISKPLREIANITTEEVDEESRLESEDRDKRPVQQFKYSADKDGAAYGNDEAVIQKTMGTRAPAPVIANWQGQTGGGCPFDPTGAAGPNHYVQSVNATPVKIYSKTGTTLMTISSMASLWGLTSNLGDPIVMYDRFADRWFLSQFGQVGSANKIYIAVSTTNDPTGTYYTYTYTPSSFPDYLKFSVWWDGYYMTANFGGRMWVFERSVMLTGGAARGFEKAFSPTVPSGFFCPMPADADGPIPASGTPLPIFQYTDNAWGGGAVDAIKIFPVTVNWVPATPTATVGTTVTIPTAAFDASYDPSWNDIWTPGTTTKLDGIGGILHYRVQWRKWVGYNTAVMSWGVKLNTTDKRRSIKWVELRQDQSTGTWSLYQEGVYAPSDGANRWMEGIAMDDNGSIALPFCISASTTASPSQGATVNISPSLRYTGRLASDPLGQMTFAETTAIAGSGSGVCSGTNRWGDYSQTTLDPDGVTFWYTGEYAVSATRSRVYSFQLPLTTGVNELANQPSFITAQNDNTINLSASHLPSNDEMVVDLFDVTGKQINGQKVVPTGNAFDATINVAGLSAGTYLIRVGTPNFQRVVKVFVK